MSGFKFECFYYPTIEHGEVVKTTRNVRSFEFGEEVPTKLYTITMVKTLLYIKVLE